MQLFDSHAHFDDDKFKDDAYEIIENAFNNGVRYILNVGTDIKTSKRSIELAEKFEYVYATVGVHPHEVEKLKDSGEEAMRNLCTHPKVVAVGEIGLDYYYDHSPRELQKSWLTRQLKMAKELNLPFVLHDRDAHEDIMKIIKTEFPFNKSGVFHCFSGSWEMAKELLNMGFYISVGGSLTFKNAKKTVEVVKNISLDKLLIETDSPYLTPEPFRGRRNDSSYMKLVAEKIAEIRETSLEEIAAITTENAKRLFNIKS